MSTPTLDCQTCGDVVKALSPAENQKESTTSASSAFHDEVLWIDSHPSDDR